MHTLEASRPFSVLSNKVAAREARMRRLAARKGYMLRKSRRERDAGFFALIDVHQNLVVFGIDSQGEYAAALDDVEASLSD